MKTDTTEKGLQTLIMRYLTGVDGFRPVSRTGSPNYRRLQAAAAGLLGTQALTTESMLWMWNSF